MSQALSIRWLQLQAALELPTAVFKKEDPRPGRRRGFFPAFRAKPPASRAQPRPRRFRRGRPGK